MGWAELAEACEILTFVGGSYAYVTLRWERAQKRLRLELYLRTAGEQGRNDGKQGKFSLVHLVKNVGLTKDEILQASFRSKRIKRYVTKDSDTGLAEDLLFGYLPPKQS